MIDAGHKGRRPGGPYRRVDHAQGEEHPVDLAVERRLPQRALHRSIREAAGRLTTALGDQRPLWLAFEELWNERAARREEAYFDEGYEHGLAAGRAEALRAIADATACSTAALKARSAPGAPPAPNAHHVRDERALANHCRDLAVQASLPRHLTIIALLETAWALALGLPELEDINNRPTTRRS